MTKVCRLCLQKLQRGSKYFNINAVESFTGFMPYRDQLTTCIPEMALDLIPNPVICNNCRTALKSAYDFKTKCLFVEKKIREYIESQSESEVNYDLSQISLGEIPIPFDSELEEEDEAGSTASSSDSNMSLLLKQLQRDANLQTVKSIKLSNSPAPKRNGKFSRISPRPPNENRDGRFVCTKCGRKFADAQKLALHKPIHGDEFICNFCGEAFRSLQNLRRHNSNCSKGKEMNKTPENSILTKRPHLPTKAKNHLKRWLFCHTDHPYPTDLEKQMLMQETNLTLLQVENWFINARRRILQDLTKLKNHGVSCAEVIDNTLGLQLDIEDMLTTRSPSLEETTIKTQETGTPEDPLEDIEDAIPPTAIIRIKPELDIQDDPLDITHIKTESTDDR